MVTLYLNQEDKEAASEVLVQTVNWYNKNQVRGWGTDTRRTGGYWMSQVWVQTVNSYKVVHWHKKVHWYKKN